MKVTIPENIGEITLGQYMRFQELLQRELTDVLFNRRKISLFTGISYRDTEYLKQLDYDKLNNLIDAALSTDAEFTDRFTMHGVEFGFIPDFDKITIGEFADLTHYGEGEENLNRLMAILFRPIVNKSGKSYDIVPYNGTDEYSELMKDMPLNCANGALVFFYNLANELQEATQRYLSQELRREMKRPSTSRILDGTRQLKNWLRITFSKSRRLQS